MVQTPRKVGVRLLKGIPLDDHPYKRVASTFNGKSKRTQRPKTMTPIDWIRAYDIEKEKEYS